MLDYLFPPKLRGVFSSSLVTCSFYNPTPTAEPIPGHPSSSPGQLKEEREKKKRNKFFPIKKGTSPHPHPRLVLVRKPMSSLGDHQLVPVSALGLYVGEGDCRMCQRTGLLLVVGGLVPVV